MSASDWLIEQGLKPTDYVLDVGCGKIALIEAIRYLETGHYYGFDREESVLFGTGDRSKYFTTNNPICGTEKILAHNVQDKNPTLWITPNFDLTPVGDIKFDVIFCKDLWTHFTPDLIKECLMACKTVLHPDGVIYATFTKSESYFEGPDKIPRYKTTVSYPVDEIISIVQSLDLCCEYMTMKLVEKRMLPPRPTLKITLHGSHRWQSARPLSPELLHTDAPNS